MLLSTKRYIEVQQRIASRVVLEDRYDGSRSAGVDQAFWGELWGEQIISGSVVLDPSLQPLDRSGLHAKGCSAPTSRAFYHDMKMAPRSEPFSSSWEIMRIS